jgi:hypothetical protein
MDKDIKEFIESIGASEPNPSEKIYPLYRDLFKRQNYFSLKGTLLIIKISRSDRPFWGLGRQFIELLKNTDNYILVLLVSNKEGWYFSKKDIEANIRQGRWKLREKDDNYKINPPLPDNNSFNSPKWFLLRTNLGQQN